MRQPAAVLLALSVIAASALAQDPPLREAHPGDDYIVREAMVPMRDGVRLYTLILTPKNAKGPLPILLERTPYDATRALSAGEHEVTVEYFEAGGDAVARVSW